MEFNWYIDRDFAVAQAQAQDIGRTDILLGMCNAGSDWKREFQVEEGKRTFLCGNWCSLKEGAAL